MSEISQGEVQAYAYMIQQVQREAGRKAKSELKAWIKAHPNWTPEQLREAAIAIVQAIVADYGLSASSLAADLYDGIMLESGVPRAEVWDGNLDEQVERAIRYQLEKALEGDLDGFMDSIAEAAENYVREHANETTMANCERDNRAYDPKGLAPGTGQDGSVQPLGQAQDVYSPGGKPRPSNADRVRRPGSHALQVGEPAFARVPTGAETCTYCLMLASRGFAYWSRESAGHADHRGCNCMIVPGRHGDTVQGVSETDLYDCWRELEALEAWQKKHPDEMDRAALEAKKREIVEGYGDSIMVSTDPGEVRKTQATKHPLAYEPRARMAANYTND